MPSINPAAPVAVDLTYFTGTDFNIFSGNVFFVQSTAASAKDQAPGAGGGSIGTPFKTLNFCLAQCSANNGDIVFVLPGHVENVVAAAGLTFPSGICDGVKVFFCGNAVDRAQINFNTATTAQVTIPANNVTLIAPRFVTGLDAIASAVSVTGSDLTIRDAEFLDAASMATTIQFQTSNAAKRFTIDGYTYYESTAGTQKTEAIRIVGGDHHKLYRLNIQGNFSTANVNNVTTATTYLSARDWNLFNSNTADPAAGAAAGTAAFVSTSTFSNPDSSPGAPVQGAEWAISKTLALPQSGTATAFTWMNGPIQILGLTGLVTTVIGSVANVTKLHWAPTVGGTAIDLTTGVDLNAAAAGDIYILQTSYATAASLVTGGIETIAQIVQEKLVYPINAAPGTLQVITAGSDGGTGRMQWCMRYKPMASNVIVF